MSERIQKVIAASGLASRRKAEELVKDGQVTVNGTRIATPGHPVDPEKDRIIVSGKVLPKPATVTYILNKPKGTVCSRLSQGGETVVTSLVPPSPAVYPVGRLDKDSDGLLLLSNDGTLTNRITHPSYEHSKEYRARVKFKDSKSHWTIAEIEKKLLAGVKLGDGIAKADSVRTKELPEEQMDITITVHEGRHHLIRRMCATLGLEVIRLSRTKIGNLGLGGLQPGQYRILSNQELYLLTS